MQGIIKKITCFSALWLSVAALTAAQPISFTVLWGNREIGEIQASVSQYNGSVQYDVVSDVTFHVVWKYNRVSGLHVRYTNNSLESSVSTASINEKLKELCRVTKSSGQYQCYIYPSDSFQLDPDINFSAVRLYFEEPVGISKIYSESYLHFGIIEPMGNHVYKLVLPDQNVNYYTYQNGRLMEVRVDRTMYNLVFRRRP